MLANLRIALAARGIKQIELALRLRIDPTVISQIVNGRRRPSRDLCIRIAAALDADERWLFSSAVCIPPFKAEGPNSSA
jgi:transcriptional regulator with XRE-family HTH domain